MRFGKHVVIPFSKVACAIARIVAWLDFRNLQSVRFNFINYVPGNAVIMNETTVSRIEQVALTMPERLSADPRGNPGEALNGCS